MTYNNSTELLLPIGREQNNPTHGWLTAEGFYHEAGNAYIICATQTGIRFHSITHHPETAIIQEHPLVDFIRENKMYSYNIVCYPVQTAVRLFQLTCPITQEIDNFLQQHPEAMAVYVVAHKTGGHELLVSIGGDCYRPDRGNLLSMLTRTRDLATGMLRKSSLIFPDIPALTGGKKGEFGIINTNHESISKQLSSDAIFQLSAWIMPMGIQFLNRKIK